METVTVSREMTTIDLLLFRRYGAEGQGLLAQTLELNPGLATPGPVLPVGTMLILPGAPDPETAPRTDIVDLFGASA